MAKQTGPAGGYTPQPGQRPHEDDKDKMGTMGDRPSGTVVPDRRGAKDARGSGGTPGAVGQSLSDPAWSINPAPMEGYAKPGHPERR